MHTLQTFTYCYTLRSFRILSDPLRVAHCIVVTCRRRRHCIHRALRCLGVVCTIETDRNNRLETETKQLEFTSKLLKHQHEAQSFHIISHIKKTLVESFTLMDVGRIQKHHSASLSITQPFTKAKLEFALAPVGKSIPPCAAGFLMFGDAF